MYMRKKTEKELDEIYLRLRKTLTKDSYRTEEGRAIIASLEILVDILDEYDILPASILPESA